MSLRLFIYRLRNWLPAAVIPAAVVGALAYLYTSQQPKVYQASATLYVQQATANTVGPNVGTDILGSTQLAQTYSQMITDPVITESVDKSLDTRYPGYKLESHQLSAVQPKLAQNTQLVGISVQDTVPRRAAEAVNAVARAFISRVAQIESSRFAADERSLRFRIDAAQGDIRRETQQIAAHQGDALAVANLDVQLRASESTYKALVSSYEQFSVARDGFLNSVSVYSPAQLPNKPIGPHPLRNAALLGALVFLLCVGGLYARSYFDDSLQSPEEIEELVGAPILGTVQHFGSSDGEKEKSLVTDAQPRASVSETYRLIRTNLQFASLDKQPRSLLVTSASPGEGKTTTASNLANVFAEGGREVTLLDADLRRPSLHRVFSLNKSSSGLTSLLMNGASDEGWRGVPVGNANLTVVPSGPLPPNPADILGSQRMVTAWEHFRDTGRLVIVDSPPVLAVADAAVLSTQVDGVILVVDLHRTNRHNLARAVESLKAVGAPIMGVVVNRLNRSDGGYYYHYYSQLYDYEYTQSPNGRAPRELLSSGKPGDKVGP